MAINVLYPVIDMKRTGENIKRLREERGVSVTDIQCFLGLSNPQAVYQWQKGINLPTVDHLCALSHLFDISMNDILVLAGPVEDKRSNVVHLMKKTPMMAKKMLLLLVA